MDALTQRRSWKTRRLAGIILLLFDHARILDLVDYNYHVALSIT